MINLIGHRALYHQAATTGRNSLRPAFDILYKVAGGSFRGTSGPHDPRLLKHQITQFREIMNGHATEATVSGLQLLSHGVSDLAARSNELRAGSDCSVPLSFAVAHIYGALQLHLNLPIASTSDLAKRATSLHHASEQLFYGLEHVANVLPTPEDYCDAAETARQARTPFNMELLDTTTGQQLSRLIYAMAINAVSIQFTKFVNTDASYPMLHLKAAIRHGAGLIHHAQLGTETMMNFSKAERFLEVGVRIMEATYGFDHAATVFMQDQHSLITMVTAEQFADSAALLDYMGKIRTTAGAAAAAPRPHMIDIVTMAMTGNTTT